MDAIEGRNARRAWVLLDLAATPFSVIIITVVYPIYFKEIIVAHGQQGDFLWGLIGSFSMTLVALLSPFLGAMGDALGRRREFLFLALAACFLGTLALPWTGPGGLWIAAALLVFANCGYQLSQSLYNSFLPIVARPEKLGRLSGWGFAFGYLGALASLGLALPLLIGHDPVFWPLARWVFWIPGFFLLIFAWPFFHWVPEGTARVHLPKRQLFRETFRRVRFTVVSARQMPALWLFLLAFFLFYDGVQTTVFMSSLYARTTIGFSFLELGIFFALIQTMAFGGASAAGWLSDKFRAYPVVFGSVLAWIGVLGLALLAQTKPVFFVVGGLAGVLLGSTRVSARAYFARLMPIERRAEFFGFYNLVGRTSAILGPFLFGLLAAITGQQRYGLGAVILLFGAGLIVLSRIPLAQRK